MSIETLPPLKAIKVDDGAISYLIKPERSEGMGLYVTINPDGSSLYTPVDSRIRGFGLDSEASRLLREVLHYHKEKTESTFHLAV